MRWLWWRDRNGTSRLRAEAEAKHRAARRMTPMIEAIASSASNLTDEEFAARVVRAFQRRSA